MILNLFALPICKVNLNGAGINSERIKSVLYPIFEKAKFNNADLEKQGGVSTYWVNNQLHLQDEFKPLAALALQQAKLYWKVLDITDNLQPEIEQCWANLHGDNGYTAYHSHSLMPMVASFYLEAEPNSGNIVFINPMEYSLTHIPYNGAIESKTETAVHVKTGDMVMFPGWLRHKTQENYSGKDRIVVTFNIKYAGTYMASQSPYPDHYNSPTDQVDALVNEIYRQQMIIEQLKKVI